MNQLNKSRESVFLWQDCVFQCVQNGLNFAFHLAAFGIAIESVRNVNWPISETILNHPVPAELEQQSDQVEVEKASGTMENCLAIARISPVELGAIFEQNQPVNKLKLRKIRTYRGQRLFSSKIDSFEETFGEEFSTKKFFDQENFLRKTRCYID